MDESFYIWELKWVFSICLMIILFYSDLSKFLVLECESINAFMNIVFKVYVNNKKYKFQIHVLLEACMG
jgi:hypothetical protein